MKSKDNDKDKITLESIDKRLDSIEKKIDKDKGNTKAFFFASILLALGFALIAIGMPILIQLVSQSEYNLWINSLSYLIIGIFLLYMAKIYLEKNVN